MLVTLVLLVLIATGEARPIALDQTLTLADKIEQLHEGMEAIKKKKILDLLEEEAEMHELLADLAEMKKLKEEDEVAQEARQIQTLGQLIREEPDESRFARKHRDMSLQGLIEGLVAPADVDEEALQKYIERFHKTLHNKSNEVWLSNCLPLTNLYSYLQSN